MSIWTSEIGRHRRYLALGFLVTLAACSGGFRSTEGGTTRTNLPFARKAPTSVAVSSKSVVIAGPAGFCVDKSATRDSDTTSFVLLGTCSSLSRSRDVSLPDVKAVLTATVGGPGSSQESELNAATLDGFFRSEPGRNVLSRNGNADGVEVTDSFFSDQTYFVYSTETPGPNGFQPAYWRAVMDVNSRLVSLTVQGLTDEPIGPKAGLQTMTEFVNSVRNANNGVEDVEETEVATAERYDPPPERVKPARAQPTLGAVLNGIGILRRIVN